MRLPEGSAQSHAYYVELCRSQGLVEVTAAELAGGAPAAAGVGGVAVGGVAAGGFAAGGTAAQQIVIGVQEQPPPQLGQYGAVSMGAAS